MSWMLPILDFSSVPRLPQYCGSAVGSNRSAMSSKASRPIGSRMHESMPFGICGQLLRGWDPLVPIRPSSLGLTGSPDLHGFYEWVMDSIDLLIKCTLDVVHRRQTTRLQAWSNWIWEDISSQTYQWLRPDFVSPAPYLFCKPEDSPNGSGILVQPALIDAHFRKAWIPYFCSEGHR